MIGEQKKLRYPRKKLLDQRHPCDEDIYKPSAIVVTMVRRWRS